MIGSETLGTSVRSYIRVPRQHQTFLGIEQSAGKRRDVKPWGKDYLFGEICFLCLGSRLPASSIFQNSCSPSLRCRGLLDSIHFMLFHICHVAAMKTSFCRMSLDVKE